MELRFAVNRAESFRRGNYTEPIVTMEVNPGDLPEDIRHLIADRLDGNDVCQLYISGGRRRISRYENGDPVHIVALLPTLESLVEAVQENERKLLEEEGKLGKKDLAKT